jgi:hypothetical protein
MSFFSLLGAYVRNVPGVRDPREGWSVLGSNFRAALKIVYYKSVQWVLYRYTILWHFEPWVAGHHCGLWSVGLLHIYRPNPVILYVICSFYYPFVLIFHWKM